MISAENLCLRLGETQVLHNVGLSAQSGEHIALVGPNGAGKSTLLRVLSGIVTPASGEVLLGGKPLADLSLAERGRQLAYLPQARELAWDLKVQDVAALGRFAFGARRYAELEEGEQAKVDAALERTGALIFRDRPARSLSGGELARVHLARTLAGGCDLLLLDEPCISLDLSHQLSLMEVLDAERAAGRTIITVLHDLSLAEQFATRVVVMNAGCIVADGAPADALSESCLADVFGLKREMGRIFSRA